MDMTSKGLAVVRSFEGRALKAYQDSVGVWTIGYGNTNYDAFAVKYLGTKIGRGLTITEEQAEYLLIETMKANYMPAVTKAMGEASPQAGDGGGSFHYNCGAIARAGWVKLFRQGAAGAAIKSSLNSWNKAGGKVLAGLVRRRAREGAIIIDGDYGPEGRTPPPKLNASGNIISDPKSGEHHLAGTPGMLRLDDKGPEVQDLNEALVVLGYKVSGDVFTLATEQAVEAVQKAHPNTNVDGVAGPATRAIIGREADLKRKLKNATGGTIAATVPAGATEALTSSGLPASVWLAGAAVVFVIFAFIVWKYRDEIIALAKRK